MLGLEFSCTSRFLFSQQSSKIVHLFLISRCTNIRFPCFLSLPYHISLFSHDLFISLQVTFVPDTSCLEEFDGAKLHRINLGPVSFLSFFCVPYTCRVCISHWHPISRRSVSRDSDRPRTKCQTNRGERERLLS